MARAHLGLLIRKRRAFLVKLSRRQVGTPEVQDRQWGGGTYLGIWGPAFCMWSSFNFRNGLEIRDPRSSELF